MTLASRLPGLVLAAALLSLTGQARAATYTREQRARLDRGEVVTRYWKLPGGKVGTGWAAGVIDATPEEVFAVVGAVERYPEFFERMSAAKIIRRHGPLTYDFFYRIDMPWPLSDHWCISRNVHQLDRKRRRYRRSWRMLKGTFEHNRGSWTVSPWGKGRALLHYTVVLRPKVAAPDFVLHYVSRVALPRSVKAIRARVRQLERRRPGPRHPR
jgi:ribosome-associated toxin RatA of RatAB toxin-antitoxin module